MNLQLACILRYNRLCCRRNNTSDRQYRNGLQTADSISNQEEFKMSKKLVAYFSASGVTKSVAERIAKVANADLFEIKPTMPYTNADLDWRDKTSRSSVEMSNPDSRPKIANKLDNMADYDTVLIGFPIWWYVAPTIIDTFVENYDLSGKTIVPFATSGGSGMGKTVDVLSKLSPNAKWQTGKMVNGISEKEIKNWVSNL